MVSERNPAEQGLKREPAAAGPALDARLRAESSRTRIETLLDRLDPDNVALVSERNPAEQGLKLDRPNFEVRRAVASQSGIQQNKD